MQNKFAIKLRGERLERILGGRRRQHLTIEEEARFLEPWIEKAEAGGVLVRAADSRGFGAAFGLPRGLFDGLSDIGPARLAQGDPGHLPSEA